MPYTLKIDAKSGIAVGAFTGRCDFEMSRSALTELWKLPEWDGRAVVWDARSAVIEVPADGVEAMGRFILTHQPETPPARVAFVTDDNLNFGLLRMLEIYRDDPATETCVLRDFEEAVAWASEALGDTREPD